MGERICELCKNGVEDEQHFLCLCTKFDGFMEELYKLEQKLSQNKLGDCYNQVFFNSQVSNLVTLFVFTANSTDQVALYLQHSELSHATVNDKDFIMTAGSGLSCSTNVSPNVYNTPREADLAEAADVVAIADSSNKKSRRCFRSLCDIIYPAGLYTEAKQMITLTWPIVLTQIGQMIIGPLSLIFCGHLGDPIKLDGAALAISMINATCIAIGQGLGTACDTFFSQTFGSKNKKLVGIYLQRALCIFMVALIPCIAVHINMESFLIVAGQNPKVSRLAGRYLTIFLPGSVSFFLYIVLSKYMQNQNIVLPNVIIGIMANGANAALHYVFLYRLQWSTDGSAIAQATAYVLLFLLTLLYIIVFKVYKETWDGWSSECFQDWGKFLRLCVPGMLMLCMEWWGFEIGVFLTGLLGTVDLGAQSVLLQIDSTWFQIPLGIQIACAIRVGQHLGSGDAVGAKTASRLAITIVLVVALVGVVLFFSLQTRLPYLFTNVRDIAELTSKLLPIVILYMFFDGLATACKGVLYGTGRQIYGAALLFVSYYVLALPTGVPLMFLTSLRSAGYWWALAGNLLLQAIVLLIVVAKTDWQAQVTKAQERAGLMGETLVLETETTIVDDEHTALLESGNRRSAVFITSARRRLVSASLNLSDIMALTRQSDRLTNIQLFCRRSAILLVMLMILGAGIGLRLMLQSDESYAFNSHNSTISLNSNKTLSIQ